jgi:transcriptional regulator with XRE-family HTH domain
MSGRRSDAIDELVGRNIKLLRLDRGMSQTELARKIGVTFQQVQKYENGTNRLGSSRLFMIATVLDVPIIALFDGAAHVSEDGGAQLPSTLLVGPYAFRLAQAFSALENNDLRQCIVELVELIASRSSASRAAHDPGSRHAENH